MGIIWVSTPLITNKYGKSGRSPMEPGRLHILRLRVELEQARLQHNAVLVALVLAEQDQARRERRRRRWWVKPWLQRRLMHGQYDQLMQELMRECEGDFKSYMRIDPEMFREMLAHVGPHITKNEE
jgi:hypothetical protein